MANPVILAVDDDPEVLAPSSAISGAAFGKEYRVIAAIPRDGAHAPSSN